MVREKVFVHNNAQIMERKMWQFILGSTGFILYFIYDINSVRMKNAVLQKFFAAGSILVVVSLIAELYAAWGSCHRKIGTMTGFGLGGSFSFVCSFIRCFLRFPLKKPIVKKINCVRLIQKVCMDCAAIRVFYGLQERICACGEWSVDGNKGFIFSL